jgi:hypothetical protein
MTTGAEQADRVPAWELVLRKCWCGECPKIATCRDGSGWWWCDDHRGMAHWDIAKEVTWQSATQAIRRLMETAELEPLDPEPFP